MGIAKIRFGTSGWRAVLADEFTYQNVRRAVTGIARHVTKLKATGAKVIVARDPRYMGETFVDIAASILSTHGVTPLIADAAPTPAISHAIIQRKADGAINFTASHNPPEYNGIKFNSSDGAPALPDVTKSIEQEIEAADREPEAANPSAIGKLEKIDVMPQYLARLKEIVDLKTIAASGLKVVFDPLWGAGRGYSDRLLREAGVPVTTVHDIRDVLFGGHAPEPEAHLLQEGLHQMRAASAGILIATDGDADRFGIMDGDGTFLQPNYVIALLFDYLVETRAWKNGVAKSVATTNLINALADHHKVELHETPVGFKYIGELIKQDKIAIGGEESAGLSVRHHVPEKDGIIAGLLCCEMVAKRKKSLPAQLQDLFVKVGSFYPVRENFHLTPDAKAKFTTKLACEPRDFYGKKIAKVVRTDGLKLILDDGSWVCYRVSGTEPVVRAYSEARSEAELKRLSGAARDWIFS